MIRKFFSILALLLGIASQLRADQIEQISPFALITIPKSGSHLVIKALHLLTGGVSIWHTRFPSFHYIPTEEGFLYTHFCLSPALERDYLELPKLKKIINIRDLRDVCVSIVHQIKQTPWPGMNNERRNAFLNLSFDEQLFFVINYEYDVQEVAETAPNSLQVSVSKIAEQAKRYCADPNSLVCKYENLVGAMGNGTQEDQILELRRIADFLKIPVSEDYLQEIAFSLYGDEYNPFGTENFRNFGSTFHKGKIGSWKTAFNEENKKAFKKKLGKALIDLGYEKDDNW